MRVLVVKTSSMGDVIHALPAITDAGRARPDITLDWVVEEAFTEIPGWHTNVDRVVPVALRRWRRHVWRAWRSGEWRAFKTALRARHYDAVIDAQGLLKSAWLSIRARGPRYGYDRHSIREPLASGAYHHRLAVSRRQHAVTRIRQLFAGALDYPVPATPADYGLPRETLAVEPLSEDTLVFLHGTARAEKCWPEAHWLALGRRATEAGYRVRLPWGSDEERKRADRLAATLGEGAEVLPRVNLTGLAATLAAARAVVGVDTGLGHLAAALGVPGLSLYGPTDPTLIGALGRGQHHLRAEDRRMASLTPENAWSALRALLEADA